MKQPSIIPGVILVIFGVAIFGDMNHWWQLSWIALEQLWPLIIIFAGVRLILPTGQRADWLFASLIIIGSAAVISAPNDTWQKIGGNSGNIEGRSSSVSQESYQGVDTLDLTIDSGATELELTNLGQDDGRLYTAISHGANLDQTFQNANGKAKASLSQSGNWLSISRNLTVAVSSKPTLTIHVNAGASQTSLNLAKLKLDTVSVDSGASSTTIKLGSQQPNQTVDIDGGAMSCTVQVPKDAGLRIIDNSSVASTNFADLGLNLTDSTYTSADFMSAATKITVYFDGGAGNATIERY